MDEATFEEKHVWREYVKQEGNFKTFDPTEPLENRTPENIVFRDLQQMHQSDCILVNYFRPSAGTCMEIMYCYDRNIPVYIVNSNDKPLSPWIQYFSTKIFNSLSEAINFLNKE